MREKDTRHKTNGILMIFCCSFALIHTSISFSFHLISFHFSATVVSLFFRKVFLLLVFAVGILFWFAIRRSPWRDFCQSVGAVQFCQFIFDSFPFNFTHRQHCVCVSACWLLWQCHNTYSHWQFHFHTFETSEEEIEQMTRRKIHTRQEEKKNAMWHQINYGVRLNGGNIRCTTAFTVSKSRCVSAPTSQPVS